MRLDITSAAERPDRAALWSGLTGLWPRFMTQDETGDFFYDRRRAGSPWLPFDTSGAVTIPYALGPVHCDVAGNRAVYVEPNVWVHHKL